jgi:WD40 repeat protein
MRSVRAQIASGSADDKVLLWDGNSSGTAMADGSPPICQNKYTLVGHTDSVLCLAFSAASKLLFSGSNDATVRVWSADTRWSCIQVLSGHNGPVLALGSLDQAGMVFSCSDDRYIRVWKKQTWEIVKEVPDGHASAINNTVVTRRNRFITFDDASGCVWSVDELSPLRHVDLRGEVSYIMTFDDTRYPWPVLIVHMPLCTARAHQTCSDLLFDVLVSSRHRCARP